MDVFTRSFGTQEGDVKYVLTSCKLCSEEDLKKLKPIEFYSRKHFRISGPPKILEAIQEAHEKKKCPKEWKFLKSPTNTSPACLKIDMKYSDDEVAAQVQSFLENGITRKVNYNCGYTLLHINVFSYHTNMPLQHKKSSHVNFLILIVFQPEILLQLEIFDTLLQQ